MKQKISLINMPWWVRYCPPYILAYFASYLRACGHEVSCFDLNNRMYHDAVPGNKKFWEDRDYYSSWENESFVDGLAPGPVFERYVDEIIHTGAQVVIFTTHTASVLMSYKLAKRLKEKDPGVIIIFFGHKASRAQMAYDFIEQPFIDYVCPSEADIPLKKLLEKLGEEDGRAGLPREKGFLVKSGGKVFDCGKPEYVKDLDSLPFPDYSDFKDDIVLKMYSEPHRLDILDSRGCVNACHFCYERLFWPGYRTMGGARILEQIKYHMERFPQLNYFYFNGLLLNGDLKALEEFCDLVLESGMKFKWAGQAMVRADMSAGLIAKMSKAGCAWLGYGIESGSQKVLDSMNKRFDIGKAVEILKNTRGEGIDFQVNIMFGIPTETREDFEKTLKFIVEARPYISSILASQSFFTLEKETYVYKNPEKFGIEGEKHHLFWSSDGGKNNYEERFRRYEEFCALALKLGIPETSGVLRVKPDKWFLLGQYYRHEKRYEEAAGCFERSIELESGCETTSRLKEECLAALAKNTEGKGLK